MQGQGLLSSMRNIEPPIEMSCVSAVVVQNLVYLEITNYYRKGDFAKRCFVNILESCKYIIEEEVMIEWW